MILKALFLLLPLIILPDVFLAFRFLRHRRWQWQLLWYVPSIVLTVFAIYLATQKNFLPDNPDAVFLFLLLFGLIAVPKAVFALCCLLGTGVQRLCHTRRNYGMPVGIAAALLTLYVVLYGTFVGFQKLEVNHVEVAFDTLPAAFDGYRIVQFSDAHVGTYTGARQAILKRAVDSINAQKADLIVFTGDLQNMRPEEIDPHMQLLQTLKAKDGVMSVVGNHDYAEYIEADEMTKVTNFDMTVGKEQDMGWDVLVNSCRKVRRGEDHIMVAGMANDGEGRFPQRGDIQKTLWGVSRNQFVVMLEHDPTSWRRKILRNSHAQLTLSGHTHGGQFSLFGWSPASLVYNEYEGLYQMGQRYLYVSKGLGGVIPFRFGATGEIAVITLRKTTKP